MTDDLDMPAAEWRSNGLVFSSSTTFEQWRYEFQKADGVQRAIGWIIGDAILYGEDNFSEWSQVVDAKYAEVHRGKMTVARTYPLAERREGFSWSFHRELAAKPKEERDRWFGRAISEGWNTVARLKELTAAESKRTSFPSNGAPPTVPEPPSASEDGEADPITEDEPEEVTETDDNDVPAPAVIAGDVDANTIRELIADIRTASDGSDGLEALHARIEDVLGVTVMAPLEDLAEAVTLRQPDWLLTVIEQADGWEVRLRKAGQRHAIALGQRLPVCIVEAVLAAKISDLPFDIGIDPRMPRVVTL